MNYLYAALLALALLGGAYGKGRLDEYEKTQAQAASVRAQDVAIAKAMEPQLTKTLAESRVTTVTLTKQVTRYVDRYVSAPGAVSQTRPIYFLTWGAVGLWNQSLDPRSTAGTPSAPPESGLTLSPITFDAAEANAITNFGQYRDCRTIVAGWQAWYRQVRAVKP